MAQGLPFLQNTSKDVQLLMSAWFKVLNPFFKQAISTPVILQKQSLTSGVNTIFHGLGYPLSGWQIVRKRAWQSSGTVTSYDIMDEQDPNPSASPQIPGNSTPQNNLLLFCTQGTTSNPVIVDILVF
jgi:hypothetical protein